MTKTVKKGGMIYHAKEKYVATGELTKKDIQDICKQYNMRYTWAVNDFVNIETIKNIYNI